MPSTSKSSQQKRSAKETELNVKDVVFENVVFQHINTKKFKYKNIDYVYPNPFFSVQQKGKNSVGKLLNTFQNDFPNNTIIRINRSRYIDRDSLILFLCVNIRGVENKFKQLMKSNLGNLFSGLAIGNAASASTDSDGIEEYRNSLMKIFQSNDEKKIKEEFYNDHEDEFKTITPKMLHLDITNEQKLNRNNHIPQKTRFQNLTRRQKEKTRKFIASIAAFSVVTGSNFFINLDFFFKQHKKVFWFYLKSFIWESNQNQKEVWAFLKNVKYEKIPVAKQIFIKDEIRLPDWGWDRLVSGLEISDVLAPTSRMRKERRQIDLITFEEQEFKKVRDGWINNPQKMLDIVTEVFEQFIDMWNDEREKAGEKGRTHSKKSELPKRIIVKSTEDGKEIDHSNFTFLGYQLIIPQIISTKSPLSWFFSGVINATETKNNIQTNFGPLAKYNESLDALHGKKGDYEALLLWISDLSALSKQLDNELDGGNVCFRCWYNVLYKKLFWFRFHFREFKTKLGIVVNKILNCILHTFQRLVEKLSL